MKIKTLLLVIITVLMFGADAIARNGYDYGGSSYDAKSGNRYTSDGNGNTSGYNDRTGSAWSSQSHGSQTSGVDSKGNAWQYDRNTGVYQNSGTGETRQNGKKMWP